MASAIGGYTERGLPSSLRTLWTQERIFNGVTAEKGEIPYQVGIHTDVNWFRAEQRESAFICGGSILSKKYVLTALHCVEEISIRVKCSSEMAEILACLTSGKYKLKVVVGDLNRKRMKVDVQEEHVQERGIKTIIPHPDWKKITIRREKNEEVQLSEYEWDFALLELDEPLVFYRDYVEPICLPIYKDIEKTAMKFKGLLASGWGITRQKHPENPNSKNVYPTKLQKTWTEIIPCKHNQVNHESRICTKGLSGGQTCEGDSGGPLAMLDGCIKNYIDGVRRWKRWVLIGVASYGDKPCQSSNFDVFAKVYHPKTLDWLKKKVKDLETADKYCCWSYKDAGILRND